MSALWKSPAWSSLLVEGPDAATWLNGLVTCDVTSVGEGRAQWGSLLTKQGKVFADLQIVGDAQRLIVGVSGGQVEAVLATLDGYLVMEDAVIKHHDAHWVLCMGEEAQREMAERDLAPFKLPWGGTPVFAVVLSVQEESELGDRVTWATELEWETARVKNGWFRLGVDYESTDNLHAASLERRTVDWQKGCYLGQEVVCMQDMRGKVRKRLVVLALEEGELPEVGDVLVPETPQSPGKSPGGAESQDTPGANEEGGRITSAQGLYAIASVKTPFDAAATVLSGKSAKMRVVGPESRAQ